MDFNIIGAGAQAKYALEIISNCREYPNIFSDDEGRIGKIIGFIKVRNLKEFEPTENCKVFIAHGSNIKKEQIYNDLFKKEKKIIFPKIVHDKANISISSFVREGALINPFANIGPYSDIGSFCMIHSGVLIDHDCIIDDFVNIAPGVKMAGGVHIGKYSYVFTGSTIIPNIKIGRNSIVAAGSVVTKNVPDNVMVAGCPAVVKRENPFNN
jgi:sugar O-acyltransferase (sialic acid O-acetyltransferase NeuD family)